MGPRRAAFYVALVVFAVSFASFCLLYDEPVHRARQRIAGQLAQISAHGLHAEDHQRHGRRRQASRTRAGVSAHVHEHDEFDHQRAGRVALLIWGVVARRDVRPEG